MPGSLLGAAVKRVEDPRFLTGHGRYLSNRRAGEELWMSLVRSPYAHAHRLQIDTSQAVTLPGVEAVLTAADLDIAPIASTAPDAPEETARPLLAAERVRFVGEPVAVVLATSPAAAADAAEAVWVDAHPLPTAVTVEDALAGDAPLLYPQLRSNQVLAGGDSPMPDLMDDADLVFTARVRHQRLAAVPLEPNHALAIPEGDGLELWVGSQNVFSHRSTIARLLGLDRSQLRVRVPDMGGGFGAKIPVYPEQVLAAALALRLGRPVRWQESRRENLMTMAQGRAQLHEVEVGVRRDGRVVAFRCRITQDAGAYPLFGAYLPHFTRLMATGPYRIPRAEVSWRSVVTNTTPVHAYRGAGRPEATATLERVMDLVASRLGLDPAEVRRRNLLSPNAFPYRTPTGALYDSGNYPAALERALGLADYPALRDEQQRRRADPAAPLMGVGVSCYVEVTAPQNRKEWGAVEVDLSGDAVVRSGSSSHGQGHETAFAQVVSELLRIPLHRVRVIQGDTGEVEWGGGTMGSRSLQLGGTAVLMAAEAVLEKARRLVAHLHEAAPEDVVLTADGRVGIAGAPGTELDWAELARLAVDPRRLPDAETPGLRAELTHPQEEATYPFGCHVSVVEVDRETGAVRLLRHVAVDDCGRILNRVLVDGQIHGGVAQAVGQALTEQVLHDPDGTPLTANLATYLLPVASDLPSFRVDHTVTPTPQNPLGVKGVGEAGTIGATPAVWNAVIDALSPLGVEHFDMPATPQRVWEAMRDSSKRTTADPP